MILIFFSCKHSFLIVFLKRLQSQLINCIVCPAIEWYTGNRIQGLLCSLATCKWHHFTLLKGIAQKLPHLSCTHLNWLSMNELFIRGTLDFANNVNCLIMYGVINTALSLYQPLHHEGCHLLLANSLTDIIILVDSGLITFNITVSGYLPLERHKCSSRTCRVCSCEYPERVQSAGSSKPPCNS